MGRYALLSVFAKTGIVDLAKNLTDAGYTIISTGGTFKTLSDSGIKVTPIDQITGNPRDSFDGRMKTISFQIEGGILYDRTNPEHVYEAKKLKVPQIDIVVCNLYPFEQTIAQKGVTFDQAIAKIDVGGPTMIRSAAKNNQNIIVLVDPKDYSEVGELILNQKVNQKLRQHLAGKAFYHLAFYDAQIGNYLSDEKFPEEVALPLRRNKVLRYGENPHQTGALYTVPNTNAPLANLERLVGQELSETNIGDFAWGLEAVRFFGRPAATVVKHNSSSGLAEADTIAEALEQSIKGDPVSAFGGTVVLNRPMSMKAAKLISQFKEEHGLIDIIAAPDYEKGVLEYLTTIRKKTGIYKFGKIPAKRSEKLDVRFFFGGAVLQDFDNDPLIFRKNWKVVTKKKPTEKQLKQMEFAWRAVKAIRSNAVIVVPKDKQMTVGIGSGQTARVYSTKIALEQAKKSKTVEGAILASDSFFPQRDSVDLCAKFGIGAIIEQGGSVRDQDSIDAANEAGIPMVFTNYRAFRH